MKPAVIVLTITLYFLLILVISRITSRKADNETFYLGNRKSPWLVVAIGMLGASLSGVTFISVPGWVVDSQFSYLQMVMGYILGYVVIAEVLMPMYYRLNLTSIYAYLDGRFGIMSYKTGASFFLVSRIIGASFRLYLVASVLHLSVFSQWNIPFWLTVCLTILLIWLYTYKGGIRTIIWTDLLQTFFMILAVILTVRGIRMALGLSFGEMVQTVSRHELSQVFFFSDFLGSSHHFVKQFLSGMFITIVMTGLDQDMMQKNLSCKSLKDAKKNMYLYSWGFLPMNLLFLSLGVLLVIYARQSGIELPAQTDDLYPLIALQGGLSPLITILFILGLIAAAYSSADSALTALTTSFTVDILGVRGNKDRRSMRTRKWVHLLISLLLALTILLFRLINDQAVIGAIFTVASYTYGPLLGLFAFGLFTKRQIKGKFVPWIALASPLICYLLDHWSDSLLGGYSFGYELLIVNGLLTFTGLWLVSRK